MERLAERYDPDEIEAASRAFWTERSRRRDAETATRRAGRPVRQFLGTLAPSESVASTMQRSVVADAEARYLRLGGRRVEPSLRIRVPWVGPGQVAAVARRAGAGVGAPSPDPEGLPERRQWMLGRLADGRVLVARELPLRVCPRCETPRTPETIVYESAPGHAYLVRFPLPEEAEPTSLLVWTDEVWKLLGTVALLVNPETSYVVARFSRRGVSERVVVSRAGLARVTSWLSGSEVEVLEEKLGADLAGATYRHPLALEYPPLSGLMSPSGTVVASNDVSDTGSGIVTLTPAHGAGDAAVARSHRMEGPAVVGRDGRIESEKTHKYAGLELDHAEAFILRDLADGGALFAELMVRRGVPHCAVCGSPLRWVPGRAWCLEPGRLNAESLGQFARLLPDDPVPLTNEVVPWSVSGASPSVDPADPLLSECSQCERLSTSATGERCACGGAFVGVRRKLLPAFREAIDTWGSARDLDVSDPVRLYLLGRRRTPALLHHLSAREALDAPPTDLRLVTLPTLPPGALDATFGQDALRAALLRTSAPPRSLAALQGRVVQEARRMRKLWALASRVLDRSIADGFVPDRTVAAHLAELSEEDRAFLSTFERVRADVRLSYESGDLAGAQGALARFVEEDLRCGYLPMASSRLALPGLPPEKVAVYRVLHHIVPNWADLYAPIAPFAMEAIHRAFRSDGASIFDRALAPGLDSIRNVEGEGDYELWLSVVGAVRKGRRGMGVPATTVLPRAILLAQDEVVAGRLRATASALARLLPVTELVICSPEHPWDGRHIEVRPVLAAIQRTYGAQSARVVRILEQIPARKVQEGIRAGTLSIAFDGRTMPILGGMVELEESLPPDVVPVPWGHGELLLGLAPDATLHRRRAPALSLEGYRVVRHVGRRLRRAGGVTPELVVIAADAALGEELARHAAAVSEYLGVGQVAVNDGTITMPPAETTSGRGRRGSRWRVYIPGVPIPPVRVKVGPTARGHGRVPEFIVPRPEADALKFLDQAVLDREATVREIVDQVDRAVGRPIVGPAKVGLAFDAGFQTFDGLTHAPFEALSAVPGFGPFVAAELVSAFGGHVPPRRARPRPVLHRPGSEEPEPLVPEEAEPTLPDATPDPPEGSEPPSLPPLRAPQPTPTPPLLAAPAIVPPESPDGPAPNIPGSRPRAVFPLSPQRRPDSPSLALSPLVTPPEPAAPATAPVTPSGPASGVRLSLSGREEESWRKFLDATSAGHRGLCLSREFPERRRALLGPRDVEVVWLSNVGKGSAVRPGDLAALTSILTKALSERDVTAVFVEGGEYLVRLHGVAAVAALLKQLDGIAVERSARVWVPINPALMAAGDVEALTAAVASEPADRPE
jgi:hypothetical protein